MKTFIEAYGIWIVVIGVMLLCLIYFGALYLVMKKYDPKKKGQKKVKENKLIKIGLLLKKYDQPDVATIEKFLYLEIECFNQESFFFQDIYRKHESLHKEMMIDYEWLVLNTDETFDDNVKYEL
jgi:hypothetical protein